VFEESAGARDGRSKVEMPLICMHVVDEANNWSALPQRREERNAVLDIDYDVAVSKAPPILERSA
jgi:hypothetical protein